MSRVLGTLLVLACAVPAFADNLATEWIDRINHEVQQEEGPLSTRPVDFHVYTGLYGYYTDNLFLTNSRDNDGDSALIGFARGRLDYTDTQLEISADLLVNFDYFMEHHEGREDQEHFYGKIRWTDGVWDLQLVEFAVRESDALDAVFSQRARRLVTDTLPRVGVELGKVVKLEAFLQIETVRFEGSDFDARENENYRGGLSILADVTQLISIGLDGGILGIHYHDTDTTPSAEGAFLRGSLRGDPLERLHLEVAAGWSGIRSRDPANPSSNTRRGASTFDAEIHVQFEATKTLKLYGDYTRKFGFAGFGDPYQQIDEFTMIAEWQALEKLKVRARGQYDHVNPSISHRRTSWSGTLSATLQVIKNLAIDGGVTFRGGNTIGISDDSYHNWIVYLGVIVNF